MTVDLNVVSLGSGPPVVAIHGLLLGNAAQWYFTLGQPLSARHRVVMFDLRGHGRSPPATTGYDLATLGADLTTILADLEGPVDLVGHSYGGLVALNHAIAHPDQVRRLVLMDLPLPPSESAFLQDAAGRDADGLVDLAPAGIREEIARGGRRARRLVERLVFLVRDTTLLQDIAAEAGPADAAVVRVPHPTLCLVGEASACRPAMQRLSGLLPRAELRIVSGGHFIPVEATAEMVEHVVEFLDA